MTHTTQNGTEVVIFSTITQQCAVNSHRGNLRSTTNSHCNCNQHLTKYYWYLLMFTTLCPKKIRLLYILYSCKSIAFCIWNLACDILMTLAIKHIHNLPPHLGYVSTLPDITQKRKSYVVFLSIVWVALKRIGFGVSEVALSRLCG